MGFSFIEIQYLRQLNRALLGFKKVRRVIMRRRFSIGLLLMLLFGINVMMGVPYAMWTERSSLLEINAKDVGDKELSAEFPCLPPHLSLDDVVTYRRGGAANITVKDKLIELKAYCYKGKLVDAKRREIRFFNVECWGNPPPDYQEIQQKRQAELERLQRRYTVIILGCDPRQVV